MLKGPVVLDCCQKKKARRSAQKKARNCRITHEKQSHMNVRHPIVQNSIASKTRASSTNGFFKISKIMVVHWYAKNALRTATVSEQVDCKSMSASPAALAGTTALTKTL